MNKDWNLNLPAAGRKLHDFLRHVDSASAPLWSGPQLNAAIYRYVEIFLPMLAAHAGLPSVSGLVKEANRKLTSSYLRALQGEISTTKLADEKQNQFIAPFVSLGRTKNAVAIAPIPPLDVAFCWALHRLSPLDYAADCTRLFGAPLPTKNGLDYIGAHNVEEERSVVARLQWACFGLAVRETEKTKPFKYKACRRERLTFFPSYLRSVFDEGKEQVFKFDEPKRGPFETKWVSPLRYDLVVAADQQKQFLYNVSSAYYDNDTALHRGAERYRQFLMLMRDNPGKFLVPTYDIDLVWHAHILLDTKAYVIFTKKLVGRFVNHKEDDDRKEGGELDYGYKRTMALWYKEYGEEYEDINTNYKGRIADDKERVYGKNPAEDGE